MSPVLGASSSVNHLLARQVVVLHNLCWWKISRRQCLTDTSTSCGCKIQAGLASSHSSAMIPR